MKKVIVGFCLLTSLFLCGCGNLSPRDSLNPKLQQDINNQQGRIDRIENNQNAVRAEISKLLNQENNNNGVQILQGDGGLIFLFGLITIFLVLFYFYKVAAGEKKTSDILAEQIVRYRDKSLESNILKAAENTEVEAKVCGLIQNKKMKLFRKK